jgi:hypothetical protein
MFVIKPRAYGCPQLLLRMGQILAETITYPLSVGGYHGLPIEGGGCQPRTHGSNSPLQYPQKASTRRNAIDSESGMAENALVEGRVHGRVPRHGGRHVVGRDRSFVARRDRSQVASWEQ